MTAGQAFGLVALLGVGGFAWWKQQRTGGRSLTTTEAAQETINTTTGELFSGGFNIEDLLVSTEQRQPEPLPELENTSPLRLPRGIRNNNPGNIKDNGTNWQGLASPGVDPGGFLIFTDARYGIRAMARILASYQGRGVDTLPEIISTWAPSSDGNDVQSYIYSVSARSGLSPVAVIFREDWPRLIEAIIHHENGQQPYTMKTILEGISWA